MNFNAYSTVLLILSGGMFGLFIYSIFQNRNKIATIFSFLCMAMTIYTFFYGLELMSTSVETIRFFLKLEYFGVVFLPILWFQLAYRFYYKKSFDLKKMFSSFIIPFVMLLASSTNDYHNLVYKSVTINKFNNLYLAHLEKGIFYLGYVVYTYTMIFLGQILFYKAWKKSKNIRKTQALVFFLGSLVPVFFSILYLAGKTPGNIDPMPLSYAIFSILCYIAIFKFEFLEMKEIVREISFEQINEGILVVDEQNRMVDFNLMAQKTFPFLNPDNIGINIEMFPKDIFSQSKLFYEVKYQGRSYEFRASFIYEKEKNIGKIYIFTDISEKKAMIGKLQYNAKYDFLSKVYNRHELFELAEIELYKSYRYKRKLAFLMIDIDYFKKINDTYGHIVGDSVIMRLAKICKSRLRPSDIIGRYGGEEFLILLTEISPSDAVKLAEEIREKIEKLEIKLNNNKIKFTISIGVRYYKGDKKYSLIEIIDTADKALYTAKQNGRNRVEVFEAQESLKL